MHIMEDNNIPDQEAFVAGMLYDVFIFGGDSISSDRVFFVNVNNAETHEKLIDINYVENGNVSSELGENYYQILIEHALFPTGSSGASYVISFQLYLGGNVARDLDTFEKCTKTDGLVNGNFWDSNNNRCYILTTGEPYEYSAQFKAVKAGGE